MTQETTFHSLLESFVTTLEDAIHNDPPINLSFADILLDGMKLLKLTNQEVAREFGVSRPTIICWKNGKNEPHPLAQKSIYRWLIHKALIAAERIERQVICVYFDKWLKEKMEDPEFADEYAKAKTAIEETK